jgi:hypothetical protein
VSSLAALLVYAGFTTLSVMPLNPLKIVVQPTVSRYFDRFFSQNWNLFAPTPVSTDMVIEARCLTAGERAVTGAAMPRDGWSDISQPLWRGAQGQRFSAYGRLIRPQTSAAREMLYGMGDVQVVGKLCTHGDANACELLQKQRDMGLRIAKRHLTRIGSAFCADHGQGYTAVAMRVRERNAIPWGDRGKGESGTERIVEAGIFDLARDVAAPGIFLAGR